MGEFDTGRQAGNRLLLLTGLFPSPERPASGTFIYRRAQQLASNGWDIQVLTLEALSLPGLVKNGMRRKDVLHRPVRDNYHWDGLPVRRLNVGLALPLEWSPVDWWRVYRLIGKELERLISTHDPALLQIATGGSFALACGAACRKLSRPYLSAAYGGNIYRRFGRPWTTGYHVERRVLRGSRAVVCVSQKLAEMAAQMAGPDVETIQYYYGVDIERFAPDPARRRATRERLGLNDGQQTTVYLGNLLRTKGVGDLLGAMAPLLREDADRRLLLIGGTPEGDWPVNLAGELGVATSVKFTGPVDYSEIPGLLSAADLFVFPSWQEGLPNAVMEAAASELPIVATNVGGIPEIIDHGLSGLLVPPRAVEPLREAIGRMLGDVELTTQMRRAARAVAVSRFNFHENGAAIANRFREIAHEFS